MFFLPSESVSRSQHLFSFQNHILVVLQVRKHRKRRAFARISEKKQQHKRGCRWQPVRNISAPGLAYAVSILSSFSGDLRYSHKIKLWKFNLLFSEQFKTQICDSRQFSSPFHLCFQCPPNFEIDPSNLKRSQYTNHSPVCLPDLPITNARQGENSAWGHWPSLLLSIQK